MDNKTKIILSRPNEWLNRARSYRVIIDDHDAGAIKNGSSEEFLLSPGKHQVQCKLAWYSSAVLPVDINQDEIAYLVVSNGMKYYWPSFILLLLGVLLNLSFVRNQFQKPLWVTALQLVLILPTLLYMFYYMTAGRKNYLRLEEDKDNIFVS